MPAKEAYMAKHTIPAPVDTSQTTEPTTECQEKIRIRAYQLFEQRGGEHGHDIEDWLQAEMELVQQKPKKIAA
jgi:Protein of unknown function (DUF2934)